MSIEKTLAMMVPKLSQQSGEIIDGQQVLTQEAWIAPTLINSWVNYDVNTQAIAGYMKDQMGFVHLKGLIKSGIASSTFILPVGYRPSKDMNFPTVSNNAIGVIVIMTNGSVEAALRPGDEIFLSSIYFKAEQ